MADLNNLNMGGQNNTLSDLATMFLASQQANPPPDTGPKMIVAGGKVMGRDVSQPSGFQNAMTGLSGLANSVLMQQQAQKRNQFFKSVNDIMGSNSPQEEKKNNILQLIMQHQGNDYGLGIKDVLVKELGQPKMPVYKTDASGNLVQVGTVEKGAKVMGDKSTQQTKLQSIVDMTNKTPEEIQTEVKTKNPAYYNYLKAINEGRDMPKYTRYGDINQIKMDVNTLWPDFDESKFTSRIATRKGFTAGKEAWNIRSLNTAVQHLDELNNLIPQLQNIGFRKGNALKNILSKEIGKPAVTNFNMVKSALSGELATIFKNSGGTDVEIANISNSISDSNSPEQLKGVIQQAVALMSGRMAALDSQWKGVFGDETNSPNPIMNTKSKGILNKLGLGDYTLGTEIPHSLTTQGKTVVKTGTYKGKKVMQYSDGTVDYQAQ